MVKQSFKQSWSVKALLGWMTMWMLAIPLVHIHPEADHAHGRTHHQHGGLVHSVLSEDLPCEFGIHPNSSSTSQPHSTSLPLTAHSPSHFLNHAEITFSVLTHSSDLPLKKQTQESVLIGKQDQLLPYCVAWGKVIYQRTNSSSYHLIISHFSRPPPILTL